jgi:hypothetical protein
MYKLIFATYALTLAISLLVIDGHEIIVTLVNYIFFFGLCMLEKSRNKDKDQEKIFPTSTRTAKEERVFASMSH